MRSRRYPPALAFLQISDSHVGFNKPANPDALGTLREAIGKVKAVQSRPGLYDPYGRYYASVQA